MPEMHVKCSRTETSHLILKSCASQPYNQVLHNKLKPAKQFQDAKEIYTDLHEMLIYPFCECFLLNFVPFIWKGEKKI